MRKGAYNRVVMAVARYVGQLSHPHRGPTLMTTTYLCRLRGPVILGLASGLCCIALAVAQTAPERAHMLLHLLDYVAVDYPECVQDGAVLDQAEYDEQLEFSQQVRTMLDQLPAHPDQSNLLRQAEQLISRIQDKRPGLEVSALAQRLRWDIIRAYKVDVAPKHPPDLRMAAALYQAQCSACHGPQGQGDGPAGASLDPAPSNFHDRQRMDQRSVYSLYSTITLGVQGTAMSSFRALSEDERWALAFYVSDLDSRDTDLQRGAERWQSGIGRSWFPDLASLVTQTAHEVRVAHGDDAVHVLAYLRHQPDAVVAPGELPLARSTRLLRESLAAYRQGQAQAAQDLAASGYLDGFELVEASLDTIDRRLRMSIEAEMMRYRAMLKSHSAMSAVEAAVDRIQGLLSEAQQVMDRTRLPASAVFISAFVILLREGLEAILVMAAIFALLIKGERRDALPYVHVGWIAALASGGITWLIASYIVAISGSTREVTEGVTALVAAAVLLYVGFWMHGKAYAERWRLFLHSQLHDALSARTMWALALVSFLAVYREAFETVLFYQALWVQAAPAYVPVLGGVIGAAVALALLGWLIFRGSVSLPLAWFFGATSWLLAVLSVVFVGKGVAALQEAGTLPVDPVSFPGVPALGLYPSLQGLGLQALLILAIAGVFAYTRYASRAAR
jgi:high-affinity iron transporter